MKKSPSNIPVSLIVPIFNEYELLPELEGSLSHWSVVPTEIIFVITAIDEFSRSRITSAISSMRLSRTSVKVVFDRGGLPGAARNVGLKVASERWVAFIDAGIVPTMDWLEQLWNCATQSRSVAVYGMCRFSSNHPFGGLICALSYGQGRISPVLPASLFHTSVFEDVGYFDEGLRSGEDILWKQSLIGAGIPLHICKKAVVEYSHFPSGLSSALKKWFVYEQSAAAGGVRGSGRALVLFVIALSYSVAASGSTWGLIALLAYLLLRGGIDPIRRSPLRRWWCYWWQPLAALPVAAALDLAAIAGRIATILGHSRFRQRASRRKNPK